MAVDERRLHQQTVRPGESAEIFLAHEPYMEVFLDSGAFRAVWEIIEGHMRHANWEAQVDSGKVRPSVQALQRAAEEFRRQGRVNGTESPQAGREGSESTAPEPGGGAQPTKVIERPASAPAKKRGRPRKAAATTVDVELSPRATKVFKALEKLGDWQSRSSLQTATKLLDNDWRPAVKELLEAGLIKVKGEKRGTRYSVK